MQLKRNLFEHQLGHDLNADHDRGIMAGSINSDEYFTALSVGQIQNCVNGNGCAKRLPRVFVNATLIFRRPQQFRRQRRARLSQPPCPRALRRPCPPHPSQRTARTFCPRALPREPVVATIRGVARTRSSSSTIVAPRVPLRAKCKGILDPGGIVQWRRYDVLGRLSRLLRATAKEKTEPPYCCAWETLRCRGRSTRVYAGVWST